MRLRVKNFLGLLRVDRSLWMIRSPRPSARLLCLASLLASLASCTLSDTEQELSGAGPSGETEPGEGEDDVASVDSALTPIDPTADYLVLTAGVTSVDSGAASISPLALTGPTAFPVLIDESSRVFAAASRSGLGKVLVFGKDDHVSATVKNSNFTKIVMNAINWMANKPSPVIGIDSSLGALKTELKAAGYNAQTVTPSSLGSVSVFITKQAPSYSEADFLAIRQFVANGGGFIYGGQAWSFTGIATDFAGNKMLSGSGIFVTKSSDISSGFDTVSATPPSMLLNAWVALGKLTDQATGASNLSASDQALAASAAERVADTVPISVKELWDQAASFIAVVNPVITAAAPLVPATNVLGRVAVRLQNRFAQDLPVNEIRAHASASDFPGVVPQGAPRETLNVTINGTYAGQDSRYSWSGPNVPVWRSTGAYAAPGEMVTVSIPPALAGMGLSAQVGAHSDLLWNKASWTRFPSIVRSYPLTSAQTSIASAFGGPVYITVPGGKAFGQVAVTLTNVVRAPLYVHGQTNLQDWLTIRDYPAPWAEIASDKMILMVPSSNIKTLANPTQLMNQWDLIMDADADLASISHARVRPERYLADRDISAGYMHSGYPIMGPLGEAPKLVNAQHIGTGGAWGFWHEVGHNHQWNPWVMQGTVESSVNWYSVYVSEVLFNIPRAKGHSALKPASRAARVQTYVAGGAKYATWGSDAWLPLEMYLQLQEWFGWQPFKDLTADYLLLSPAASPSTDQARVDQWVLRFSQNVGKDLGPFFKTTWGLPVSQTILDQLALLAPWPASSAPIGLEIEPNDACAQAQSGTAPVYFDPLTLSSQADVDWFALPAGADDVGKVVHVVTAAGQANTNTVVEVLTGSCATLTTLGGPSSNAGNHEDWLSTPIPQGGTIYVKVSYSSGSYLGSQYNLTITYQ